MNPIQSAPQFGGKERTDTPPRVVRGFRSVCGGSGEEERAEQLKAS
jgi:hypothetical protein